ncbi:MAG: ribosome recycling factor [Deltaproteobacteria bacterium]|nr:ribosome recycling factor [Deltaproteobacteria bacterium]
MKELIDKVKKEMEKTLTSFTRYIKTVRTGRAQASLVENIPVSCYGAESPIKQVALVSVPDATHIVIQPWDPNIIKDIEKAILKTNIGITPINDGRVIRLNIPPLTEEDKNKIIKEIKKDAEKYKTSIRNIRKKANNTLKEREKGKEISEDDCKRVIGEIQKLTDQYIKKITDIVEKKGKEILSTS